LQDRLIYSTFTLFNGSFQIAGTLRLDPQRNGARPFARAMEDSPDVTTASVDLICLSSSELNRIKRTLAEDGTTSCNHLEYVTDRETGGKSR
jgi:hypothetical protein